MSGKGTHLSLSKPNAVPIRSSQPLPWDMMRRWHQDGKQIWQAEGRTNNGCGVKSGMVDGDKSGTEDGDVRWFSMASHHWAVCSMLKCPLDISWCSWSLLPVLVYKGIEC